MVLSSHYFENCLFLRREAEIICEEDLKIGGHHQDPTVAVAVALQQPAEQRGEGRGQEHHQPGPGWAGAEPRAVLLLTS